MSLKRSSTIYIAGILLLLIQISLSCPACNIHNYLEKSLQSSPNIYVGEVINVIGEDSIEIEITQILRGTREPGEREKHWDYRAKEILHEKFIFSDPQSFPPTYPMVAYELFDEVNFLLSDFLFVSTPEEAVEAVQRISITTQALGREYIKENHRNAVPLLITDLENLLSAWNSGERVFFGAHRLQKLTEALFINKSDKGERFLKNQLDLYYKKDPTGIIWDSIPDSPTRAGYFMKYLLLASPDKSETRKKTTKSYLRNLTGLSGMEYTEICYALLTSKTVTPKELQQQVKSKKRELFALALLFTGKDEFYNRQYKTASQLWKRAYDLTENQQLKNELNKNIKKLDLYLK